MRTVYSTGLYEGTISVAGAGVDLWTVPDGFVDVVRSVDAYTTYSGDTVAYLGDASLGRFLLMALPVGGSFTWVGHQVFAAGQVVSLYALEEATRLKISGYRLSA